jgi:hypothetical protein
MTLRSWLPPWVALALCACAGTPAPRNDDPAGWHGVALPGKKPTRYVAEDKDGRRAVAAISEGSASLLRRTLRIDPDALGTLSFAWWVDDLMPGARVDDIDADDASARVLLAFDGDRAKLSSRTRAMFDLAEALTGEAPPYATLMYVWDATLPVDSVVINPRTDRVRKIVVDSGVDGLRRWREHRRDVHADFVRAFGEPPGPLRAVAVMTDSDNTRGRARTWYGSIEIGREGAALRAGPEPPR